MVSKPILRIFICFFKLTNLASIMASARKYFRDKSNQVFCPKGLVTYRVMYMYIDLAINYSLCYVTYYSDRLDHQFLSLESTKKSQKAPKTSYGSLSSPSFDTILPASSYSVFSSAVILSFLVFIAKFRRNTDVTNLTKTLSPSAFSLFLYYLGAIFYSCFLWLVTLSTSKTLRKNGTIRQHTRRTGKTVCSNSEATAGKWANEKT